MSQPEESSHATQPSRRDFLKTSSAAISTAAVSSLAISRAAHAAGSDTIKVGLVGCGGRGGGAVLQAMNADPGVRIVALADLFDHRLSKGRELLEAEKPKQTTVSDDHCFVGFDAYQKVIDSDVDVVFITNTSRFHARHLKACVDAGKHTFVEKPAALDPPDVKIVLAAADEADKKGLNIVSGLMYRYDPGIQETMKRVHDGAIGDVESIQLTTLRPNFRLRKRLPGQSEIEYQFYNWTHFSWLSGDYGVASLVHHTDLAAWAMKEEHPENAFGMGGRAALYGEEHGDCFDHHAVVYEYADGRKTYAYLRVQPGCYVEVSDIIQGTKGRAHLLKYRIEGENAWQYDGPKRNPYQVEQDELFTSIRSGRVINNGHYMGRSTMAGILGQIACYTGKQITWDQAMAAENVFGPTESECRFSMEPPVKPDADGTYPIRVPGITRLL